jgi:hypothetical protein
MLRNKKKTGALFRRPPFHQSRLERAELCKFCRSPGLTLHD